MNIKENEDLAIEPSALSSESDFDFLEGTWIIKNRKLKDRLCNSNEWVEFTASHDMHKILTGMGNMEKITADMEGKIYEGMGIRLFNPITKLWTIYWADNNSVEMETPVVGSFNGKIGLFFCKSKYKDKNVLVQFKWDVSDASNPIWSQAFSIDQGKTWEWNWYMHFSKNDNTVNPKTCSDIKVMELRNYLIKSGRREEFIDYFEENFVGSQNNIGASMLGRFRVKNSEDNFCWFRGFKNMESRYTFLNNFYFGPFWKAHKQVPNSLLLNNDNVYLLKPLKVSASQLQTDSTINADWFIMKEGIAVVNYYISNTKLPRLVEFIKNHYYSILQQAAVNKTSFWVSESLPNDFTGLPVFQDTNLLVQIAYFKNEFDYQSKMKIIQDKMTDQEKLDWQDLVTQQNTMILYPTYNTLHQK